MKCQKCEKEMEMLRTIITDHNRDVITVWKCYNCGYAFREKRILQTITMGENQ